MKVDQQEASSRVSRLTGENRVLRRFSTPNPSSGVNINNCQSSSILRFCKSINSVKYSIEVIGKTALSITTVLSILIRATSLAFLHPNAASLTAILIVILRGA